MLARPITGVWLMHLAGYSFRSPWFAAVVLLYALAGTAWIVVLWIQYRVRRWSEESSAAATSSIERWLRLWAALGVFAFGAVLAILVLMVFRHALA